MLVVARELRAYEPYQAGRIDREEYLRADPADLVVQLGTPSPRASSPHVP